MTRGKWVGLAVVMGIYLLQMVVYSQRQPRIVYGRGRGDDGITYGAVAEQILAGDRIKGDAPFVYRIGGPLIVALWARVFAVSVDDAFQQTSAILIAVLLVVIYFLALDFSSPPFAAMATALCILPWWSYARSMWFYPVLIDIPWMIIMLVGLRQVIWWPSRDRISIVRVLGFSGLCFIAAITRETGVLLPSVFFFTRFWRRRQVSTAAAVGNRVQSLGHSHVRFDAGLSFFFLISSVGGLALPRFLVENTSDFDFVHAVAASVQANTVWHFVTSMCLAYGGPLMALVILYREYLRTRLRGAPPLVLYVAGVILLAYIGGVATLRFLSWASPVVMVLLAHLAQKLWSDSLTRRGRGMCRILLATSGIYYLLMIHPFEGYYSNYRAWVDWGGVQFSSIRSLTYIVPGLLMLLFFVFLGRRWIPDTTASALQSDPPFPDMARPAQVLASAGGDG